MKEQNSSGWSRFFLDLILPATFQACQVAQRDVSVSEVVLEELDSASSMTSSFVWNQILLLCIFHQVLVS